MALGHVPSELKHVVRWRTCRSHIWQQTLFGGFVGGVVGLLALRVSWGRTALIGVGCGFGFGSAFSKCRYLFAKETLYNPSIEVVENQNVQ